MATLNGTDNGDILNGSAYEDLLLGHAGNDTLLGGAGWDRLAGGSGDDYLSGGEDKDDLFGEEGNDTLDGGSGSDNACYTFGTVGVAVNLSLGIAIGGYGNDRLVSIEGAIGTAATDILVGDAGQNFLHGNGGDDYLDGAAGNDTLKGAIGNDIIDGGSGIDIATFDDALDLSGLYKTASGWEVSSADGIDELSSIERLHFSDTSVALDIDGNAGQVYRLYQAAVNRTPDPGGLGDWIYGMDTGMSLLDVAAGFMNSQEFATSYGASPTNAEIVTRFYQNVLHRAPEQAGFDYWMNQIENGLQTRLQVLTGFSESAENQAQVIGVIQGGIEYTQHQV